MISDDLSKVNSQRLRANLFSFCREPFSFRTVMYTIPWHSRNSLLELDDFIVAEMRKYTQHVTMLPNKVRPFRCDSSKPLHHWYSAPLPEDPEYDANSIEVVLPGEDEPEKIIQLVSHKDSMSWINSPGAYDNAVGAVCNMELVRVLSSIPHRYTVRVLFCNEEHWPWHSKTYAEAAFARKDNIIAVMNQDSLCGKSEEDGEDGVNRHTAVYSTQEGLEFARFIGDVCSKYHFNLNFGIAKKAFINDDDGSFINAGYLRTVMNKGTHPNADAQYHLPGDIPERVSIENLTISTQLLLAVILEICEQGLY